MQNACASFAAVSWVISSLPFSGIVLQAMPQGKQSVALLCIPARVW
jgi:hypothetical protein